jgi:hypothetical protein
MRRRKFHLILFLTAWTEVLREKLIVAQLVKKCLLKCSEEPVPILSQISVVHIVALFL